MKASAARPRWIIATVLGCCLGCGDDPTDQGKTVHLREEVAAGEDIAIELIAAKGDGCPPGSWQASLLGDRRALAVDFERFGFDRDDASHGASRDCTLSIRLRSPHALAYAPTSVQLSGVSAGPGVYETALQWEGSPDAPARSRHPVEGSFDIVHEVREVSSRCGREQVLQATLQGRSRGARRAMRSFDLGRALFTFAARPCEETEPVTDDAGTEPAEPTDPAPAAPTILGVTADGQGCPPGSFHAEVLPDRKSFTASFERLSVTSTSSAPSRFGLAHCIIFIELAPSEEAYAIDALSVSGSVRLEEGVSVQISARPGWVGQRPASPEKVTNISGPREGPVALDVRFDDEDGPSRCARGGLAQVGMSLVLDNGPLRASELSLTGVEGVKFTVRRCKSPLTLEVPGARTRGKATR